MTISGRPIGSGTGAVVGGPGQRLPLLREVSLKLGFVFQKDYISDFEVIVF